MKKKQKKVTLLTFCKGLSGIFVCVHLIIYRKYIVFDVF